MFVASFDVSSGVDDRQDETQQCNRRRRQRRRGRINNDESMVLNRSTNRRFIDAKIDSPSQSMKQRKELLQTNSTDNKANSKEHQLFGLKGAPHTQRYKSKMDMDSTTDTVEELDFDSDNISDYITDIDLYGTEKTISNSEISPTESVNLMNDEASSKWTADLPTDNPLPNDKIPSEEPAHQEEMTEDCNSAREF